MDNSFTGILTTDMFPNIRSYIFKALALILSVKKIVRYNIQTF